MKKDLKEKINYSKYIKMKWYVEVHNIIEKKENINDLIK